MKIPNFIVWFKLPNGHFRTFEHETQSFETVERLTKFEMNQFEYLTKKDKKTDDDLIEYSKEIILDRSQLMSSKRLYRSFDYFDNNLKCGKGEDKDKHKYIFFRNHSNNVKTFIKRLVTLPGSTKENPLQINDVFEQIHLYEEEKFVKCYRGGLTFGQKGEYNCWTYDFKFFYASIMASKDYHIPLTKGIIKKIKVIPKCFKFGIYNIQIISNDKNFDKVFAFSKDHHYTHYSLNFVLFYNLNYNGKIELILLSNEALIYNDLISGSKIFFCWYSRLLELRVEFPENKLIKKLGSTGWGEIQSYKSIYKTEEEVINENLEIGFDFTCEYYIEDITIKEDTELFKLVSTKEKLYDYNFRMKAFITDYARVKMAKIALKNIDDVVRIQTDSITYSRNINPNIPQFILDGKKTGKFEIKNKKTMIKLD